MTKRMVPVLILLAVCGGMMFGQTVDDYGERGVTFMDQGKYDKAIQEFTRVIQLDPNIWQAYLYRGIAYCFKDNPDRDRGIADLTQALRLSPSNKAIEENLAMAYYDRGLFYFNNKNYDKTIADFTEAIRLDPEHEVTDEGKYNGRGLAYYFKGNLDRAIADFETALKINPNNTSAKDNLEGARKVRGR